MILASFESWVSKISTRTIKWSIAGLAAAFVGFVLLPALHLANELTNDTAALGFIAEVRRYPVSLQGALDSARDRLGARAFVQKALDTVRQSAKDLDGALETMAGAHAAGWFDSSQSTAAFADHEFAVRIGAMRATWAQERQALGPVLGFKGVPYQDSASGSELNADGEELDQALRASVRESFNNVRSIEREMGAIGTELQARSVKAAQTLRIVMMGGLGIAGVLAFLVIIATNARKRQERLTDDARRQTQDIMRTVKDGLFLLDENLIIGDAYSAALVKIFQREDLKGLEFGKLLEKLVPTKTLETALKYVKLLWTERTKENLIRSINPLGEVEVHFDTGSGTHVSHWLEFDFHRVRSGGSGDIKHVLVSVSDITARVALERELQQSREKSQSQLDTLLGILHIEPAQLNSFLRDSDIAMQMVNAVLKEPAREEAAFRKKLDTIFRQVHSVKGEAAALGLASIESRAHSFEDDLRKLQEKQGLSGNDLLPLVIKLDDLFTYLQSIRDLVSRLATLQLRLGNDSHSQKVGDHTATDRIGTGTDVIEKRRVGDGLEGMFRQLADRTAAEQEKRVELEFQGFSALPNEYRRTVKDIVVQTIRNSIVHGIETPAERAQAGKNEVGAIRIELKDLGKEGYKLILEDDGRGLSVDKIKEAALARNLISRSQAESMDARQAMTLVFRAGFSSVDSPNKDAGRGVGMNLVAELTQAAGGKIGLSTALGKYTRFSVTLPALDAMGGVTAVAV